MSRAISSVPGPDGNGGYVYQTPPGIGSGGGGAKRGKTPIPIFKPKSPLVPVTIAKNTGSGISYDPTDITTQSFAAQKGGTVGVTGYVNASVSTKSTVFKWAIILLIIFWMFHAL